MSRSDVAPIDGRGFVEQEAGDRAWRASVHDQEADLGVEPIGEGATT